MTSRLDRLRLKLTDAGLDALIISEQKNRSYVSGISSSDGFLIVSQSDAVLALDSRYSAWASRKASPAVGIGVVEIEGEIGKWLPDIVSGMKISKLGFEDTGVTYNGYNIIKGALGTLNNIELVATSRIVSGLRAIKDAEELESMQKAASVADDAFERMRRQIKVGMTEKQAAWLLESTLRECGSSSVPFGIIVASGPNAAFPHHAATDRPIGEGDPVIIDFGARVGGYGSDITRTLYLGEPGDKYKEIYGVLLDAQQQAFDKISDGMSGDQADATAREVIDNAGYGQYFLHALGHGTGLEVHEEPRLGKNSQDMILEGMVFTIEPGIYIQGWGGIRIEDMVVLQQGRIRVLTGASK